MESLKIQTEELAPRQTQMTVEVPPDLIRQAMQRAARQMSRRTKIAGFRPGKAPFEVVVQRYGEEAVFEEAIDSLGQDIYRRAIEQVDLDPVAPGSFDDVVSREPLVLRYTVPLNPTIGLGDYRELRLPFEAPEVEAAAVEEVLEGLRQQQAVIEPAERPAAMGDVVVLHVHGALDPEGGSGDGTLVDEDNLSLLLADSTDFPFAGVAAELEGIGAGETRQVRHVFPDDYSNESLRAKATLFRFDCRAVKSRQVPEWSDELARDLGEFDDLADLRQKVRQSLEARSLRQAEAEFAEKALETVVEGAEIAYPPILLRREVDDAVRELEERLKQQRLSLSDYLKIEQKEEEQLRQDLEPQARRRLERGLVLGELVEAEKLEVDEAEVEIEVRRLVEPLSDSGDRVRRALDRPTARRRIALDLLTDKALARLVQIARGEAVTAPDPEPSEADASEQGEDLP